MAADGQSTSAVVPPPQGLGKVVLAVHDRLKGAVRALGVMA